MCDKERKDWIDSVKAICMLGVYLLHSEAYYGTGGVSYGYALTPFYVNAFFFVSGYLFLGKRTGSNMSIFVNRGGGKKRPCQCVVSFSCPHIALLLAALSAQDAVSGC